MKGQDRLIAMRCRGCVPELGVSIETSEIEPRFDWLYSLDDGTAVVWVQPGERPDRMDMRFVCGLRVLVFATANNRARCVDIAKRCADEKAERAFAVACGHEGLTMLFDSAGKVEEDAWLAY